MQNSIRHVQAYGATVKVWYHGSEQPNYIEFEMPSKSMAREHAKKLRGQPIYKKPKYQDKTKTIFPKLKPIVARAKSNVISKEQSADYKPWYASPGSETLEIRTKPNAAPDVVAIPESD